MTKKSRPFIACELNSEFVADIPWFRSKLLTWFCSKGRIFPWRDVGRTGYEILIAEILLQRTNATKVAQIYSTFLENYPSWTILANANLEELKSFLNPLGLMLQKALVFQSLSRLMKEREGSLPSSRSELEQLPGVGQYIANAILLTVYKQPEPLLDINMARVLERFFSPRKLADIRYDPYLQTLANTVVDTADSLQLNWAILDLGAMICKSRTPLCQECPLSARCRYPSQKRIN